MPVRVIGDYLYVNEIAGLNCQRPSAGHFFGGVFQKHSGIIDKLILQQMPIRSVWIFVIQ
jgi:hypothetical protein